MKYEEFKKEMDLFLQSAQAEGETFKDPYIALDKVVGLYKKFDFKEKQMADRAISEWLLLSDDVFWHTGLTLVSDLKITSAIPYLERFIENNKASKKPGANSWISLAKKIILKLSQ
jgi:hypothetical protein